MQMRRTNSSRTNASGSRVGLYHIQEINSPMELAGLDQKTMCIPRQRADYFWLVLRNGIQEIQQNSHNDSDFEELHRYGYLLVMHKYGGMLYNGLKETIAEYLKNTNVLYKVAREFLKFDPQYKYNKYIFTKFSLQDLQVQAKVAGNLNDKFLNILNIYFERHIASLAVLRGVLMYLDTVYVPQHDLDTIYTLGLKLFKTLIVCFGSIQNHMQNMFLELVRKERDGQKMDRTVFRSVTRMLMDLGINTPTVYQENFEQKFLEESRKFYSEESEQLMSMKDVPLYLMRVELRLSEELERSQECFDQITTPEIIKVVEDELITNHMAILVGLSTGVLHMLENQQTDDLGRMYSLFGRVPGGLDVMFSAISCFIKAQGEIIIAEDSYNNPIAYVENLLELKDKIDFYVGHSLANDKLFSKMLTFDFEHILNLNTRSPENIAIYIDDKMKRNARVMPDEDNIMVALDKTLVLFRFLQEKDIFEGYYKQLLAKRLLFTKTNDENEKYVISKLKGECGLQFTRCFDGMLRDMRRSVNLTEEFRKHPSHSEGPTGGLELSMRILTLVYWPQHAEPNINLPLNIEQAFNSFKEFYLSRHNGRQLKLLPQRGSAEITFNINETRSYTLIVSTFQMCVLMLFNNKNRWTFQDLLEVTEIPLQDLQRALSPLITGKTSQSILIKQPNSRAIEPTDWFFVNSAFFSKSFRVKVAQNQGRIELEPDRPEIVRTTTGERLYEVEAAIMRIMKSEKRLNHDILVNGVIKALSARFEPSKNVIRTQIESLIDKEYLARNEEDRFVAELFM